MTILFHISCRARGDSKIVIKKLTDQLQEQKKEFESLKEQEDKIAMEGEGSVQESQADSFTSKSRCRLLPHTVKLVL